LKRKKETLGMDFDATRRSFLKGAAMVGGLVLLHPLLGYSAEKPKDFPTKPLNHIVPSTPGGGFDGSSRVAAMAWEKKLGVPIKFSHIPGGSTVIGVGRMVTATDGYTTSITTISMLDLALRLQKAPFTWDDLIFIGNLATDPNMLMVHKDAPWKTAREFIEAGKKSPTPLKISTSHPTANNTLAARIFIQLSGIKAEIVAFDAGGKARNAVAGKHVDACCGPMFGSMSSRELLRGLVVFQDANPVPDLWPGCKPIKEALDFDMPKSQDPYAVLYPKAAAKNHPERYRFLMETFHETLTGNEVRELGKKPGLTPFLDYWSPEKCDKFVADFAKVFEKYGHLLKK
jgi:tripartite-type tricarboxylate transporter receptor subunit TctC